MATETDFSETESLQDQKTSLSMHTGKFITWLFIVGIVMFFAAITSAYIVRKGEGNWLQYRIPPVFWVSTVVIFLSSLTLQLAYVFARKDKLVLLRAFLVATLLLGLGFLYTQFLGWQALVDRGVYLVGNPGGSFSYVITGLHAFHLLSGLVYLVVLLWQAARQNIHSKNLSLMEMGATYWHFLDGLWIYLFFFLLLNHNF